ncbi:MAG: serine hydrolase [Bacteroidota bacterium]
MTSCHVGRFFYWNVANIDDYKKFPSDVIEAAETPYKFPRSDSVHPVFKGNVTVGASELDFNAFLEESRTAAFLVIRNDTLLFEAYPNGYEATDILTSFSVAKSFVSALIGIALEEGHIRGLDEPITNYITDLSDTAFARITIDDLLNMRSGIAYDEGYFNPFGYVAKYYYGRNLKRYNRKLEIAAPPDSYFQYVSVNTQLLAEILEQATGRPISAYMEEKIWRKIGTAHEATWSVDSKQHHTVKAFCCINALAIDFAKFGRLYAHRGNWDGEQVIPARWVDYSTRIHEDSKQLVYTYQWWHTITYSALTDTLNLGPGVPYQIARKPGSKPNDQKFLVTQHYDFMAEGILGQFIYVYPPKNLVIVRLGKYSRELSIWPQLFRKLANDL